MTIRKLSGYLLLSSPLLALYLILAVVQDWFAATVIVTGSCAIAGLILLVIDKSYDLIHFE